MSLIYKIVPKSLWLQAENVGIFHGAPVDLADGFIHFSTDEQVAQTANKHFAGQKDLLLISIDEERLNVAVQYEVSRGGALFPHLYAPLPLSAVVGVVEFEPGPDGLFTFTEIEQ